MTTYYVDPANGSDANNGLSWGAAFKTLQFGPTMALLTQNDSDTIRVAKSPDPVNIGSSTWTTGSEYITIPGLSNMLVEDCESGWTNVAATTLTHSTAYFRQGTASVQAVISATAGRIAYKNWGGASADFSAMSRLSFWVNFGTQVDYRSTTNPFEIHLCSDTIGQVTVVKFILPQTYYPANQWVPVTISPDSGYSFSSATSIASVAIRCGSAATNTIRLDNIFAAKAASDATSLVLTDLICKENGGGECFPVQWYAANNTVGVIAPYSSTATVTRTAGYLFYDGMNGTQTINTLKRECFNTGLTSTIAGTATSSAVNAINFATATTSNFSKTYIGGVNPATDIVDGETWFDGMNGYGFGITQTNGYVSNWTMDRISAVRYYVGLIIQEGMNVTVTNCNLVNNRTAYEFRYNDRYAHTNNRFKTATQIGIPWQYLGQGATSPTIIQDMPGGNFAYRTTQIPVFTFTSGYDASGSALYLANVGNTAKIISTGTLTSTAGSTGSSGIVNIPQRGYVRVNNLISAGLTAAYYTRNIFNYTTASVTPSLAPQCTIQVTGRIGHGGGMNSNNTIRMIAINANQAANLVFEGVGANNYLYSDYGFALFPSTSTFAGNVIFRNFNSNKALIYVDPSDSSTVIGAGTITIQNWNGDNATHIYSFSGYGSTSGLTPPVWTLDATQTTSGSTSWMRQNANYNISSFYGLNDRLPLGNVYLRAGKQATISVQVRRADGTNLQAFVECWFNSSIHPDQIAVTTTTNNNTWETISITYTPSENIIGEVYIGVTQIAAAASAVATNVWFDGFTVTQAD